MKKNYLYKNKELTNKYNNMKRRIRLTESQLHSIIRESVKQLIREEIDNFSPINGDNEDGYYRSRYRVSLWNGKGYGLTPFDVFANNEGEALEIVVAHIDNEGDKYNLFADDEEQEFIDDEYNGNREEAEEDPTYLESFLYVDATMEGARQPHYIWAQNASIKRL